MAGGLGSAVRRRQSWVRRSRPPVSVPPRCAIAATEVGSPVEPPVAGRAAVSPDGVLASGWSRLSRTGAGKPRPGGSAVRSATSAWEPLPAIRDRDGRRCGGGRDTGGRQVGQGATTPGGVPGAFQSPVGLPMRSSRRSRPAVPSRAPVLPAPVRRRACPAPTPARRPATPAAAATRAARAATRPIGWRRWHIRRWHGHRRFGNDGPLLRRRRATDRDAPPPECDLPPGLDKKDKIPPGHAKKCAAALEAAAPVP